jgi:flagellar protein FliO/FliZ
MFQKVGKMPSYLYAAAMLAATIAGFIVLAKLLQALRAGTLAATLAPPWQGGARRTDDATRRRLTIEQSCAVDGKRRLLLVRCEEQRVLLLTGGPADLVVCVLPAPQAGEALS